MGHFQFFACRFSVLFSICAVLSAAVAQDPARAFTYESSTVVPPQPVREFRGAWLATVANIDWPSKPGLSTAEQKAELAAMLDRAAQLKLNAVIFQVRPACDALYASPIEPWSEYLTGTMGRAPEPFYDPLAFAVEEAHKRGLELHAWFNPYRARHIVAKSPVAPGHISRTHPQLVRSYGKYLWLDPGEKDVQDHTLSVVMDVVKRYDIDGAQFDDYFYPDPEPEASEKGADFPDNASWQRFGAGGKLDRADWRRENVNALIQRTYKAIKTAKPWVKFGLSPFGIWRPGVPPSIDARALDAYGRRYADSRKWLLNGWLDYFAPQLYWPIEPPAHSFPVLLKWWTEQNPKGRLIWPGIFSAKAGDQWPATEIVSQVRATRKQPGASGHIYFSMKSLMRNETLAGLLQRELYAQPALVPASPWLDDATPGKPALAVRSSGPGAPLKVAWHGWTNDHVRLWLLQTKSGGAWQTEFLPADKTAKVFNGIAPKIIAVSAVDRANVISLPAVLALPQPAR